MTEGTEKTEFTNGETEKRRTNEEEESGRMIEIGRDAGWRPAKEGWEYHRHKWVGARSTCVCGTPIPPTALRAVAPVVSRKAVTIRASPFVSVSPFLRVNLLRALRPLRRCTPHSCGLV